MTTANDELRTARQRTASLTHPGDCLTRQELAELVNTWVWDHHHKKVEASAGYVGQLERGKIRWPMRRVSKTLRAIGIADEHFAHSTPADDPPFMAFYNTAMHAGNTGRALSDLAIVGHAPGVATSRLTTAVAGYPVGQVRARAISQTTLASLTMATGDPLQAAAIGHEALDTAVTIRSRRTLGDLRDLACHAAKHQHLDEVAHLRHRIAPLACTK